MHKFSEFADEHPLTGDKIGIDSLLNKELVVRDFRIAPSKQREGEQCLTLQIILDGKEFVVFTGASVLMKQIQKYAEKVPFVATIRRVKNYYTFS